MSPDFTSQFADGDVKFFWVMNDGCLTQVYFNELFASPVLDLPARTSSFTFTWIMPLSLCFCPFWTEFCPEISQRLKTVGW